MIIRNIECFAQTCSETYQETSGIGNANYQFIIIDVVKVVERVITRPYFRAQSCSLENGSLQIPIPTTLMGSTIVLSYAIVGDEAIAILALCLCSKILT